MNHTPGPWKLDEDGWIVAGEAKLYPTEYDTAICEMAQDDGFNETVEANARLIAASPRLLKACEAVLKWWTETPSFQNGEDEMPAEIFDALRDAIAEAKKGAA